MSTAASSTKPNGTSPVTDVFVLSPEKFQIEVHEIGLSKNNPISSTFKWNKEEKGILYQNQSFSVDVAPGKGLTSPLPLSQPAKDSYNYAYLLLRNSFTIKATATWASPPGTIDYSTNTGETTSNIANYAEFTKELPGFGAGGAFASYFDGTSEGFSKVQGLLLQADKITTATGFADAAYILAVFENKLDIGYGDSLKVNINTSNRTTIGPTPPGDWQNNNPVFGSGPFIFTITKK